MASATHESGSTLDLVFSRSSDELVRSTSVLGFFSDHRSVLVSVSCRASRFPSKQISFRRLRCIDPEAFVADIECLSLLTNPSENLDCLVTQYNSDLRSLIDKHAPLVNKNVVLRPFAPWIGDDIRQSKREMRHAERIWTKHRLIVHYEIFREKRRRHNNLLTGARSSYVSSKVAECRGDSKKLFSLASTLMGAEVTRAASKRDSDGEAGAEIAEFCASKVEGSKVPRLFAARIRSGLDTAADAAGLPPIQQHISSPVADSLPHLAVFRKLTTDDARKLISFSPKQVESF